MFFFLPLQPRRQTPCLWGRKTAFLPSFLPSFLWPEAGQRLARGWPEAGQREAGQRQTFIESVTKGLFLLDIIFSLRPLASLWPEGGNAVFYFFIPAKKKIKKEKKKKRKQISLSLFCFFACRSPAGGKKRASFAFGEGKQPSFGQRLARGRRKETTGWEKTGRAKGSGFFSPSLTATKANTLPLAIGWKAKPLARGGRVFFSFD
jgi:hypothetical protein